MPEFDPKGRAAIPSCRLKSGQESLRSKSPGLSLEGQQGPSSHLLVVSLIYLIVSSSPFVAARRGFDETFNLSMCLPAFLSCFAILNEEPGISYYHHSCVRVIYFSV